MEKRLYITPHQCCPVITVNSCSKIMQLCQPRLVACLPVYMISYSCTSEHYAHDIIIIRAARMRRGKVISLSVCQSVVTAIITRSRNLGLRATRKRNQSVEIGERLALVCFESFGTVHGCHKKHLFLAHRGHAHRPCPLHCTAHAHNWPGRDRHITGRSLRRRLQMLGARGVCALESSSFFCNANHL